MNSIKRIAVICRNAHKKHLLVSNTLTTIGLLGVGDALTQYIEYKIAYKTGPRIQREELFKINDLTLLASDQSGFLKPKMNSCTVVTLDKSVEESFIKSFDWKRCAKLAALGLLIGPLCHYWYILLDKKFPTKTRMIILRKVMLDQLIAAPLCNILSIAGVLLLEGKFLNEIIENIKEKFLKIYAYDCALWPAAQAINFGFISPVYRLLYINTISVLWNSILSFLMFD